MTKQNIGNNRRSIYKRLHLLWITRKTTIQTWIVNLKKENKLKINVSIE